MDTEQEKTLLNLKSNGYRAYFNISLNLKCYGCRANYMILLHLKCNGYRANFKFNLYRANHLFFSYLLQKNLIVFSDKITNYLLPSCGLITYEGHFLG